MFKPARMTRVLLGGHKGHMEQVIQTLHQEKVVHIEDYEDSTGITTIGTPLEHGDATSQLLLRVRGLMKALDVEGISGKDMAVQDPHALVGDAEAELGPIIKDAAQQRTDLAAIKAEIAHLKPFVGIDADLSILQALASVQGYMGNVKSDPRADLDAANISYDAGVQGSAIMLAVAKADAEATDRILNGHGFSAVAIPPGATGTPARRVEHLDGLMGRTEERLERSEQRIAGHREQWGPRLASLEQHLASTVAQTQAPLSFAVTETTFHVEGWVPTKQANRLQNAISARFGDAVYFENLGDGAAHDDGHDGHGHDDHHTSAEDEPPIKLENKGLAKPYEFMLGLLGRPRYKELDPTKLMLIFFPLFFGLMVGDVLVGLAIMAFGFYLKKNHIFGIGGPSVGRALAMGGFIAAIVGLLVFGEALGIHFVVSDEALEEGEMSWEAIIYGKEEVLHHEAGFPTTGFFHKVAGPGHGDHGTTGAAADHGNATDGGHGNATDAGHSNETTLGLHAEATEEHGGGGMGAILTPHGTTHLNAGPVQLGFYSKIHDIQALLAWCIIIAFVHLNLGFLLGIRNVSVGHGVALAIQEKFSYILLQIGAGIAIWGAAFHGPTWALPAGVGAVVVSVGLLWVGVQKALGAPGFVAVLEMLGFAGNILSYTRLAAIGASKAGMALAFAAIGFDVLGGGDIQSPIGWIFYLIGMVIITLLAMLSGGLQSLRLQFVEFFSKFYEGGGRAYKPFGRR